MQRLQWGAVLFVVWLAIPGQAAGETDKPWSPLGLLVYLPVFLKEPVVANIDVATRVLNPRLPINPGIVRIRTGLKAPYQRLILANSITLPPDTVTLEMDGEDMYVHWIDVKTSDPDAAGEASKGVMERSIARI